MVNRVKTAFIVTAVGLLLAIASALAFYLDPFAEDDVWYKVTCVIVSVWLLCTPASYAYVFNKVKESSEFVGFEQAFRSGIRLGLLFGLELFILPVFIAPVAAVLYYVNFFRNKSGGQ